MPSVPPGILKRFPNYRPDPPVKRTFDGPVDANGMPTVYDRGWPVFNNLTEAQIAWFRAQPSWQNYLTWLAAYPQKAAVTVEQPDDATINADLVAAGKPIAVNPLPLPPPPPKPRPPFPHST